MYIDPLLIAGYFNLLVAVLHVAVVLGGSSWYRFFGAGESMAMMAEKGFLKLMFITLGIAIVLTI